MPEIHECPLCGETFEDDQGVFRHLSPAHQDRIVVYAVGPSWMGGEVEYEHNGKTGVMTVLWATVRNSDDETLVLQLNLNPSTTGWYAEHFAIAAQQQADWYADRTTTWRDRLARLRARWGL